MEPETTVEFSAEELEYAERIRQAHLAEVEKDPTFMDKVSAGVDGLIEGAKEIGPQAVRGAQEATNETLGLTYSMSKWLNDNVVDLGHLRFGAQAKGGTGIAGIVQHFPGMPSEQAPGFTEAQMPAKPTTIIGGITNDVSQFVTGYLMAGRAMKAVGITPAATVKGAVAQGMAKGFVADFTVFDPHEERLANLIQTHTSIGGPVIDYLAAKPDDGEAEGRLKNALEGLALGGVTETLFHIVRSVRARRAGDNQAAITALDEADRVGPKVDESPLKEAPEEPAKADPKAAEGEGAATSPKDSSEAPKPGEEGAATAPKEGEQLHLDLEGDSPRGTFGDAEGRVKPEDLAPDIPSIKPTKDSPELKPVKKLVEVDETTLREIGESVVNEKAFGQGRNISGVRTDLMESEADINSTMAALRVVYRKEYEKAVGGNAAGVRTHEAVKRNADMLADLIGDEPNMLMQRMQAIFKETRHADAEMLLYRDMLVTTHDRLMQIADVVADPLGGLGKYATRAEAYDDFAKHYELLANMQLMYKGVQTNVARTLNSMKLVSKKREGILTDDVDAMFAGGPRRMEAMARKLKATKDNPKAALELTRGGFTKRFLDSTNEYWVNSLLSGPQTHARNILGGLSTTAFMPAEKFLAGALRMGTQGGREQMLEAGLQYGLMVSNLRDSLSLAAKALKQGDAILDPGQGTVENMAAISSKNWGVNDPTIAMAVDGIGALVRTPSRFLTAEDEFFKQLNYRNAVKAQAWREGIMNGTWRDPKAFSEHVERAMAASVDANGMAKNAGALAQAREATFTNPLQAATRYGGRTIGETLQQLKGAHPLLTMVMPFVRTPTNIARFVWNRTPGVNLARQQYLDELMGKHGAETQAKAGAQMLTGIGLWVTALSYAAEGKVTGSGPKNPQARELLEATGWRPNSFVLTNEDGTKRYLGIKGLDPFSMFMSLAANYAETRAAITDETTAEEDATIIMTAIANSLKDKSYLTGLVNGLAALNEPEHKFEAAIRSIAAGFVPSALKPLNDDPLLREARSIVDAMQRKMPGYSTEVDPNRNILGEVQVHAPGLGPDWISPITDTLHPGGPAPMSDEWRVTPSTDVHDELARQMVIHDKELKPPPKKMHGVDLTQYRSPDTGYTALDRYNELIGTVRANGKTLKETLGGLIASPAYQNKLSDGSLGIDGSRINAITNILQGYRQAALGQLRKEIPELHWALVEGERKEALMQLQPQARPQ